MDPITTPSVASVDDPSSLVIADLNFGLNEKTFVLGDDMDGGTSKRYNMASESMYQTGIRPQTAPSIGDSFLTEDGLANELTGSYQIGSVDLTATKASEAHRAGVENETDTLIDIYYTKFNGGHPFLIPRILYRLKPALIPTHLKGVMQFVASHFMPGLSPNNLRNAAENITLDRTPKDGHRVQGLMLLGISLYARYEEEPAIAAINQAIDLALDLDMNFHSFALKYGMGNPLLRKVGDGRGGNFT